MENKSYLITYDIDTVAKVPDDKRDVGQIYADLEAAIKAYGTWANIQKSCWAIVSSKSAIEIRDDLKKVLRTPDRLLVLQSANIAAWHNVICTNKWMKEYL